MYMTHITVTRNELDYLIVTLPGDEGLVFTAHTPAEAAAIFDHYWFGHRNTMSGPGCPACRWENEQKRNKE